MTEVRMREIKSIPFKELREGDWFHYQNNYYLRINTHNSNAFRVSISEYCFFESDDEVTPLNADIIFSYA